MPNVPAHLDEDHLRRRLLSCCGSAAWVDSLLRRRPFPDAAALAAAADAAWSDLDDAGRREALGAEPDPYIAGGDDGTRAAAVTAVQLYRQLFGYPFVTGTDGIAVDELLMRVRIRLGNDAATELRVAAEELRRVIRSRLGRLEEESGAGRA